MVSLIKGTSTKNLLRPASRVCKWGNYITDTRRDFQEFLPKVNVKIFDIPKSTLNHVSKKAKG